AAGEPARAVERGGVFEEPLQRSVRRASLTQEVSDLAAGVPVAVPDAARDDGLFAGALGNPAAADQEADLAVEHLEALLHDRVHVRDQNPPAGLYPGLD